VPLEKLKIISMKEKLDKCSDKTWASQKGYMESKGSIILFTDANTMNKNHGFLDIAKAEK
jgi:hypothetical protein